MTGSGTPNPDLYRSPAAVQPTIAEAAAWTGGTPFYPESAPERLTGLGSLEEALPSEISFFAGPKYRKAAEACRAGLLIAPKGSAIPGRACLEVAHVWSAVATLLTRLYPDPVPPPGVHPTAILGEGATVGEGASVGPHCVIGARSTIGPGAILGPGCSIDADCSVGAKTRFGANVVLQGPVSVGAGVLLHPGVVLGADGFRFEAGPRGILKIPQVGKIFIEDGVEIGANTTVDRPFLYETRIGMGTKIDNQVQIGHNCRIGRMVIIAGCTGLAGSVTIEDGVMIGGGAGIREGTRIGAGSMIAGGSAVYKNLAPGSTVGGAPSVELREHLKIQASLIRLPRLARRVSEIERALKLEEGPAGPPQEGKP